MGGGLFADLKSFGRLRQMPTTVASRIAPLQGEYLGSGVPHVLLVGRRGQPFTWSNFGNSEGNHNTAVVGSSGSGKSVLMQEIACSLRGAGSEVFVIDDGRSFMSSCLLQGGAFLQFSLDLNVCVNPFSMADHELAEREGEYEAECKRNIVLQVETMCRGQTRATPEELGAIETCVGAVWERKGRDGCIDDVRDALLGLWADKPDETPAVPIRLTPDSANPDEEEDDPDRVAAAAALRASREGKASAGVKQERRREPAPVRPPGRGPGALTDRLHFQGHLRPLLQRSGDA